MVKNTKIKLLLVTFIAIITIGYSSFVFAGRLPQLFPFRKKDALDKWEEKIFKGRVLYKVRMRRTDGYLTAYSKKTASGIFYKLKFDPKKTPMVSWKWKVVRFPRKGKGEVADSDWIEKDDYAARFYVIFPKLAFTLTKTLEYVWDKEIPEGTIMTSPYFENIKIIVAESGKRNRGKWVFEERNVYEDFKKAFNREPEEVGAIAIMTDTDNTASTAEAHYDEIKVGYKHEE
ncbi:MAG: DUF3047 domain-containing protein [Candidatus Omnitrophota bacterium]|nr:MAG: DUF3047 domain-containing protein [Candidatus Omnitrophota bacterium]